MSSKGLRIGIEAKIEYNPLFDIWGDKYESIRRTSLNDMQSGMNESEIEKSYQSRFNIQWAWADSIATEVKQTISQLTTAKKLNIARIKEQIKKKTSYATARFKSLSKVKNPNIKQQNQALGLKCKLIKIQCQSSLLYALQQQKPITVQIFRREHKSDQWYIHLKLMFNLYQLLLVLIMVV